MVKGKSDGLKVLDFCPEYINNGFNGFIDHIQVGTGLGGFSQQLKKD